MRHDRARFFAFGLLSALNVIALLLYGLEISTNGDSGEGQMIPLLIVLAALWLLLAAAFATLRGHDLGWKTLATLAAFLVSFSFAFAFPILLFYFAWKRGEARSNAWGAPPLSMPWSSCLLAGFLLATPWVVLRIAANFYT